MTEYNGRGQQQLFVLRSKFKVTDTSQRRGLISVVYFRFSRLYSIVHFGQSFTKFNIDVIITQVHWSVPSGGGVCRLGGGVCRRGGGGGVCLRLSVRRIHRLR